MCWCASWTGGQAGRPFLRSVTALFPCVFVPCPSPAFLPPISIPFSRSVGRRPWGEGTKAQHRRADRRGSEGRQSWARVSQPASFLVSFLALLSHAFSPLIILERNAEKRSKRTYSHSAMLSLGPFPSLISFMRGGFGLASLFRLRGASV